MLESEYEFSVGWQTAVARHWQNCLAYFSKPDSYRITSFECWPAILKWLPGSHQRYRIVNLHQISQFPRSPSPTSQPPHPTLRQHKILRKPLNQTSLLPSNFPIILLLINPLNKQPLIILYLLSLDFLQSNIIIRITSHQRRENIRSRQKYSINTKQPRAYFSIFKIIAESYFT